MASRPDMLDLALRACGQQRAIVSSRLISGAGDQEVHRVELEDGTAHIAKTVPLPQRDRLDAEEDGLIALKQSDHLFVPGVHPPVEIHDRVCLIMQALETCSSGDDEAWQAFGRALAEHHSSCTETPYGWHRDNYIGATPQPNTRCNDWAVFNAEHRIGYQVSLAKRSGLLSNADEDQLRRLIDRLGSLIPDKPKPALLHGDLWSGNAICARIDGETRVAVIDPAVYVGDGWADIAMMMMFSGFPPACLDAYRSACDDHDQIQQRILVYQLYHMLNHLNLFGGGYHRSAMGIVAQLAGM